MRLFALYFELKIMHSIDFCTVLFVDLYLSVLIVNSQRGFFVFVFFSPLPRTIQRAKGTINTTWGQTGEHTNNCDNLGTKTGHTNRWLITFKSLEAESGVHLIHVIQNSRNSKGLLLFSRNLLNLYKAHQNRNDQSPKSIPYKIWKQAGTAAHCVKHQLHFQTDS